MRRAKQRLEVFGLAGLRQKREDPAAVVVQQDDRQIQVLLHRGQERYGIFCAPCHGISGTGNGMIVQRGFPPPPSYLTEKLREAPIEHFYDVITHGYGVMFPYAARVPPPDRWAIAAYIRALQASAMASLDDVPPELRQTVQ